jgi:nitrogen fixation NifU-like protein
MSGLGDLYQQLILDHNARPRNYGELETPTHTASGDNPLCGDSIKLMLDVQDGVIKDLKFTGSGCAISKSSTSLMTAAVKGLTTEQAEALFERFHEMVAGSDEPNVDELGKLAAFSGVREFPARVKCAILAWHTLRAALHGESESISTE